MALKAVDARLILQAQLPLVLKQMSDKQLDQMQRVLDAAVVNPIVQREANDFYKRAIVAQHGSVFMRDESMERRGDRAMKSFITVKEADKHIRVDYKALLTPDALNVTTDNPDERAYLQAVRNTLEAKGVWLRFAPKLVRDPDDPSRHVFDYQQFEVWISLGPDGDTIPTDNGRLTRDILLKTTVLGANYYRRVHQGPTQAALEKEIRRLRNLIDEGMIEHDRLIKRYRDAAPLVAEISDALGGADLPDRSIWDEPHKLVLRALQLNVGGNVKRSPAYLVAAAISTRHAAWLLAQYIEDSTSGAERAVTALKVARTAGHVAEIGLGVMTGVGIVRSAVRGGAAIAGEASAAAATDASVDAAAERMTSRYAARSNITNKELAEVGLREEATSAGATGPLDAAEERMVNEYVAQTQAEGAVQLDKPAGYGRSVGGNVKPGHSAGYGKGFK
jgi:hypothetical protein